MRISSLLIVGLAATALTVATRQASAALTLKIATGSSTQTIVDGGAGDVNPAIGQITFAGSVGNFATVITSGVSNSPGTPQGAILQTNNISIRDNASSGNSTITISLSDNNYTSPSGPGVQLGSSFAGTFLSGNAGEKATFQSYASTNDQLFATTNTTGLQSATLAAGSQFPAAFSTPDKNTTFSLTAPTSLTNVMTITLSAGGQVNLAGTTNLTPASGQGIPEPMSLSILGLGGSALMFVRRRRQV